MRRAYSEISNPLRLFEIEMKKMTSTHDYVAPTFTMIDCKVEAGFSASHIGDDEGSYIPDFEPENNL
jgi:hypothetical protein